MHPRIIRVLGVGARRRDVVIQGSRHNIGKPNREASNGRQVLGGTALVASIILLLAFVPPTRPSLMKIPKLRETGICGVREKEAAVVNMRD
ncbi:hypothetical protein QBC34DRAFT_377085 [Podospora aff. communis PSN243]|uniref:Uncharacterized protein n=1 Tax=Podospora aff. communis PSN243 TaxID=3040156 RepID=A0AAV9GVB6_9PEZI|nr:hypothetical protein QBC34DRAFT_377085 [Podospora aff. communis PSN243]